MNRILSNRMDDLWWLPGDPDLAGLHVYLGYHPPVRDEVEPLSVRWYHSMDSDGQPSEELVLHPWRVVGEWCQRWGDINVHRSIALYDSDGGQNIHGPFLVDIDNSGEDVDHALDVARKVVDYFHCEQVVDERDMRVFFSGRKGFHVEISPSALRIQSWLGQHDIRCPCDACGVRAKLKQCIGPTGETVIDPIHSYVRLADSLNGWIDDNDCLVVRRKTLLAMADLRSFGSDEIIRQSEAERAG